MRLPSVRQVTLKAIQTFLRFPFPLLAACVGTVAACMLIGHEGADQGRHLLNVLLAAILGIPFLTSLVTLAEKWRLPPIVTVVFQVAGSILLVAYGLTLPADMTTAPGIHVARFFLLLVSLHLLVSIAPFLRRGEINGFWHYNKTLLIRFLVSLLYSGVLYAGLALALEALQHLFGIDISAKRYIQLWASITGIFNTWFFLAGIPGDLDALGRRTEYPRGLKIFVQYILLPIIVVYLVILYAYAGKIVIDWDWPKGWVSGLVLSFSSVGVLSLLLLYPIRSESEHRWVVTAATWFYRVLPPLIIMLLLAILRRVGEYGFTEGRYIVSVLGIWLALMTTYFLFSKTQSIKMIPGSLCAIGFLISVGPWSLFSVSEKDQVHRLENLLVRNGLFVEGKIHASDRTLGFEDRRQVSSILTYLYDMHGYTMIQPWFGESLKEGPEELHGRGKDPRALATSMGVDFVEPWQIAHGKLTSLQVDPSSPLDARGYEYLVRSRQIGMKDSTVDLHIPGIELRVVDTLRTLTFSRIDARRMPDTASIDVASFMGHLASEPGSGGIGRISPDRFSALVGGDSFKVCVCFSHAELREDAGRVHITSCTADILVSLKP